MAEFRPFLTRAEPEWLRQQLSQAFPTRQPRPLTLGSAVRSEVFEIACDPLREPLRNYANRPRR
jgi:hypothetical protein